MSGIEMKYFVLKPKGDDAYAEASRAAMRKYATMIQAENGELCKEMNAWADREQIAAYDDKREANNIRDGQS